jgi:hypothetical protein
VPGFYQIDGYYKKLLEKIGIDNAVFYVLTGKGISFIVQPITLYLIATYFTGIEQGYYYTFGSILSASIFLELGLGMVLTQYASHEFALLNWTDDGGLTGNTRALSRLISLIKKSIKWYGVLSVLAAIIFIPGGTAFLNSNSSSTEIYFTIPWIVLVLFSSLTLFLSPLLAILEGCGRVADIQKMKLYQISFGALFIWIVIISHGNLFAASSLAITNFIIASFWIVSRYKGLLNQLRVDRYVIGDQQISWRKELFPMQWRIAISWISGYLAYQLFIPLLFRYQNATVAGQMGMTLYISNIALGIGIVWLSTKFPLYGAMISKKDYVSLDKIAKINTIYSLLFTILFSAGCLIVIHIIKIHYSYIGDRLLSLSAIAALLFSSIINLLITSMAGYLRAHKQEPLVISSLIHAIITVVVAWLVAKYYNADILAYSIAFINLAINLPLTAYIFRIKRNVWQNQVNKL